MEKERSRAYDAKQGSRNASRRGVGQRGVLDVAGVSHTFGFEQHGDSFFVSDRTMFDPLRHDDDIPRTDVAYAFPKLDPERSSHSHEHLVNIIVTMPNKFAVKFCEFHLLTVQPSNNDRPPWLAYLPRSFE